MSKSALCRVSALFCVLSLFVGVTARSEIVLVAASGSDNIAAFDLATGRSEIFLQLPPDQGHNPRGIVVAPDGSVFISNSGGNESVYRIVPGPEGFEFRYFAGPFERFGPGHLAIDGNGNLLVAGDDQDRVFRYDIDSGQLLDSFASGGGNVMGLALDGDTLYISEIFQSTIQRFDLSTIPAQGADFINDGRMERVFGITLGHNNNLLVSDTDTPLIYEYSLATRQFLGNFINLEDVGVNSTSDIKYSPESNTYLIPHEQGLFQFDTSGDLVANLSHPAFSGGRAVTPALNAPLPPMDFILDTNGVAAGAPAGSAAGDFRLPGAPEGGDFTYTFDGTEAVALIPLGANWKYFDGDRAPAPGWQGAGYDDSAWATGDAPLGYGDPFIETEISFGPSSSAKYPTAYFRGEFVYDGSLPAISAQMNLQRDDGAVVYLNGIEVFRTNMPGGAISYGTLANDTDDGFVLHEFPVASLQVGVNQVAVEVHQASPGSSDLAFDLAVELVAEQPFDNDLFEVSGDSLILAGDLPPDVPDVLQTKLQVTDAFDRSLTRVFEIPVIRSAMGVRPIVIRSDGVPDVPGAAFRTFTRAVLNNDEEVLVEAQLDWNDGATSTALFLDAGGGLSAVAATSDTLPDDEEFDPRWNRGLALNDPGEIAFVSRSDIADVQYIGDAVAAAEGEEAPETDGGLFSVLHQSALDRAGQLYTPAHLEIGSGAAGVSVLDDTGIWGTRAGLIAREGAASPVDGFSYGHISSRVVTSDVGVIAFATHLSPAPASALLTGFPGLLDVVAMRGDPAPGTTHAFADFHSESMNRVGDIAFRATLLAAPGVTSANNAGLWRFGRIGGIELIAREGDPVPGGGAVFERFGAVEIGANGLVVFQAYLSGDGIDSSNDGSIWRRDPFGNMRIVAREGDTAPGTGGRYGPIVQLVTNNFFGRTAFVAALDSDDPGLGVGVWFLDRTGADAELVIKRGDTFELAPGDFRTVTLIGMDSQSNPYGGSGGYGRVLSDSNRLVLKLSLGENSSGVFVVDAEMPRALSAFQTVARDTETGATDRSERHPEPVPQRAAGPARRDRSAVSGDRDYGLEIRQEILGGREAQEGSERGREPVERADPSTPQTSGSDRKGSRIRR